MAASDGDPGWRVVDDLPPEIPVSQRAPRVTPPRIVNGPCLLTGLAVCAICGGGMMLRTDKGGRYALLVARAGRGEIIAEPAWKRLEDTITRRTRQALRLKLVLTWQARALAGSNSALAKVAVQQLAQGLAVLAPAAGSA
ncbi:MAG: zinc ribbon domain-containing protein [Rhodospirillales bacterium]|nr:zinc ribbon domain-containing protein [Rhodospirillales bacterium]